MIGGGGKDDRRIMWYEGISSLSLLVLHPIYQCTNATIPPLLPPSLRSSLHSSISPLLPFLPPSLPSCHPPSLSFSHPIPFPFFFLSLPTLPPPLSLQVKVTLWKLFTFLSPLMLVQASQTISRPVINLQVARLSSSKCAAAEVRGRGEGLRIRGLKGNGRVKNVDVGAWRWGQGKD